MSTDPPAWERLKVPTLLVVASHSKHMGAAEVELFRAALGGLLTVVVVPGGHSVFGTPLRKLRPQSTRS